MRCEIKIMHWLTSTYALFSHSMYESTFENLTNNTVNHVTNALVIGLILN